ncbi:hypothetical protein BT96DRAFT_987415 [Gymnopus androsaceus JB14]|uniref:Uncharacterized protein n=1 Tax=Gymnopus androsaceus JB14 TaxID=1447944 RepID=A0A6A4IBA6_9AGAR|nr:hypothetical protein BT96DRAFT_987415 [Gymnopus androsaceus JB14]
MPLKRSLAFANVLESRVTSGSRTMVLNTVEVQKDSDNDVVMAENLEVTSGVKDHKLKSIIASEAMPVSEQKQCPVPGYVFGAARSSSPTPTLVELEDEEILGDLEQRGIRLKSIIASEAMPVSEQKQCPVPGYVLEQLGHHLPPLRLFEIEDEEILGDLEQRGIRAYDCAHQLRCISAFQTWTAH